MDNPETTEVTRILQQIGEDRSRGYEDLLPLVLSELRRLAGGHLRHERPDHTLQATALVHEAYMKLVDEKAVAFADRRHFLAVASRAMRQVLIDHARRHRAAKRGGDALRVTLSEDAAEPQDRQVDGLLLAEALEALEALDERKCRVVELRFFGGLTMKETGELMNMSPKTVEADWYMARAWLRRRMLNKDTDAS